MTYDSLVAEIASQTGCTRAKVREVLFYLTEVLLTMPVGDTVRTPLGVFRMMEYRKRGITLPDGDTRAKVPARNVVKLKPGLRMKRGG